MDRTTQQKITTGRFVVLANWNNEAVLDRETGLVWQKVPSTSQVDLFNASILCINSNTGGRKGWRVPSITEFMSLVDESQSSPALPSGHPFTILVSQGFLYWSITNTLSPNVRTAWLFHPFNGLMTNFPLDTSVGRPWCVRGGSGGVDTQ
jgi:hypothetical protein